MQPGREMDALVAEKVFGMVPCKDPIGRCVAAQTIPCQCWQYPDEEYGGELKQYSTDIAAAWEVFETLTAETGDYAFAQVHRLWLEDTNAWGWGVSVQEWSALHVIGSGATAPEAICRAALRIRNETAVKNASSSVHSAEESLKEV